MIPQPRAAGQALLQMCCPPLTLLGLSATIRLAPHDRERIGQLQPIVTRSCGVHLVQVNQLWAIAAHCLVPAGVLLPPTLPVTRHSGFPWIPSWIPRLWIPAPTPYPRDRVSAGLTFASALMGFAFSWPFRCSLTAPFPVRWSVPCSIRRATCSARCDRWT